MVWVILCGQPAPAARPSTRPATQPAETPSDPAAVRALDDALVKLRAMKGFQTQLHQTIEMLNYRFEAKGRFLWARGDRLRLELELKVLNDRHTLLEVCDGTHWYRRLTLLHGQVETVKTDVAKVREELAKPGLPERLPEAMMASRLGLRGIVPLVESLRDAFVLQVAKRADRRFATRAGQIELVGHLGRDGLRMLLSVPRDQLVSLDQAPPYVPVRCRVVIEGRTGWPTHVRLFGRDDKAYVDLRFTDTRIDATLPPDAFVYTPADKEPVGDQTPMLLAEIQQRRAAASRPTSVPATAPSGAR